MFATAKFTVRVLRLSQFVFLCTLHKLPIVCWYYASRGGR